MSLNYIANSIEMSTRNSYSAHHRHRLLLRLFYEPNLERLREYALNPSGK